MTSPLDNFNVSYIEKGTSVGMRDYFGRIYNYMAGGLSVSAATAFLATRPPFINWFYNISPDSITFSVLGWVAVIAPLIMIFMIGSAIGHMNAKRAGTLFWIFSALMGISLSNLVLLYSGAALFQAFLVTGGAFLGLSLYGYTTRRSMTEARSFLMMGLFGVIIASLINLFFQSGFASFIINIVALVIFIGLTVYDTNRLKSMYHEGMDENTQKVLAINGALALYLDFINLFRLVLYFLNDRR